MAYKNQERWTLILPREMRSRFNDLATRDEFVTGAGLARRVLTDHLKAHARGGGK